MNTNEIHVGPQSTDLRGNTSRIIQMAIDTLVRRGGGVVQLDTGEYILSDSLRMGSNITLRGAGKETLLKRVPVVNCGLVCDADKAQTQISPIQPELFEAGMGVSLWFNGQSNRYMPRYITHIEDGILYLDDFLDTDYRAVEGGIVTNEFPMIHGERADDVVIENLSIDGGGPNDDGYGSPGIYARRSKRWLVKNVQVTNCVGDGLIFSQQSTHGRVEDCEFSHCTNYGAHPGSHSAHTTFTRNDIHHNGSDGLYICWGISHSTFTHNTIHHNGWKNFRHGISIGHKDTDNLIADNHVYENWKHGIHFREKTPANSAHRCIVRDNLIENNGTLPDNVPEQWRYLPADELRGYGVSLYGSTEDLLFERNTIRETRADTEKAQMHAFYVGENIINLQLKDNVIEGHPSEAIDDRSGKVQEAVHSS